MNMRHSFLFFVVLIVIFVSCQKPDSTPKPTIPTNPVSSTTTSGTTITSNSAPSWVWAKSGTDSQQDRSNGIASDAAGNVYLAGTFFGQSIKFGSISLTNTSKASSGGIYGMSMFIVKYNPAGGVEWARSYSSEFSASSYDIAVDNAGNLYLVGSYIGSITLGSTTLKAPQSQSGDNVFLAKLDPSGNPVWAKTLPVYIENSSFYTNGGITVDGVGNIYITGTFGSSSITLDGILLKNYYDVLTGSEVFVAKYDTNGKILWARSGGSTEDDRSGDVAIDKDGNVLVTGSFLSGNAKFDNLTISATNPSVPQDVFVLKYSPSGQILWARSFGGTNLDEATGIVADSKGNIYVTGNFQSPAIAFAGTTFTNKSGVDLYLVSYDATGKELWAKNPSDKLCYNTDIGIDGSDNVYITGFSFGLTLGNKSMNGVYIGKFNSAGTSLWGQTNASALESSRSTCLAVNKDGSSYVAGIFNFDYITFGSTKLAISLVNNDYDIFIAKLADK